MQLDFGQFDRQKHGAHNDYVDARADDSLPFKGRARVGMGYKVLVIDPDKPEKPEAFFSTQTEMPAQLIIEWFVLRWNVEVTFEEVRAHLGVETQRQWSDSAIGRTTPVLMGLYSIACLMAKI